MHRRLWQNEKYEISAAASYIFHLQDPSSGVEYRKHNLRAFNRGRSRLLESVCGTTLVVWAKRSIVVDKRRRSAYSHSILLMMCLERNYDSITDSEVEELLLPIPRQKLGWRTTTQGFFPAYRSSRWIAIAKRASSTVEAQRLRDIRCRNFSTYLGKHIATGPSMRCAVFGRSWVNGAIYTYSLELWSNFRPEDTIQKKL